MGRSDHLYRDPVYEKRKEKRAGGNTERSEGAAVFGAADAKTASCAAADATTTSGAAETAAAGKTFTAAACSIAVDSAKGKGKRLEAVR